MLLRRNEKNLGEGLYERGSPVGATTLFFSVVPVNLQLGSSVDEFGDVVAAKERPGTLPASGRAVGGPYTEKSRTLLSKGVGSGGQGSKCCGTGKLESPRGRGNPPLNGLWLRG